MKRVLLSLFLLPALCLSLSQPALAAPTPPHILEKAREAFKAEAQADLCPSEEDSEMICFVRAVAIQGSFAAARLAVQNLEDSFVVYHKPKDKWVKVLSQPRPDWEAAAEFETQVPEAVYNLLAKALFPPADEE